MTVHEDTDSTNKRNYDVILGSVLRHNFALPALLLAWLAFCKLRERSERCIITYATNLLVVSENE